MSERQTVQNRLGEVLRRLRQERRLTTQDVARRMGKKPSSFTLISRWERGESTLRSDHLFGYLKAIGVSLSELDRELHPSKASSQRLRELTRQLESLGMGPRRA